MNERQQALANSIQQQSDAGFGKKDIIKNLQMEGYAWSEIQPYLKKLSPLNSYQRQTICSILGGVGIYTAYKAVREYYRYHEGKLTNAVFIFGTISLLVFIAALYFFIRKKPFR